MKTTVVKGVLTSYELVLAILFRWPISCGSDAVTCPVTGRIIIHIIFQWIVLEAAQNFGGNWFNNIFRQIVLEAAQTDCLGIDFF